MSNKFEVGTQWKTRGGWRAVVVGVYEAGLTVCHVDEESILDHFSNGSLKNRVNSNKHDLIEPWVEPVEHEFWINVYPTYTSIAVFLYETKEDADKCASEGRIACVKVPFKEGDGLCDKEEEQ